MSTGTAQTGSANPRLANDPTPKNVANGAAPVASGGAHPTGESQPIKEVDEGNAVKAAPAAGVNGENTGEQTHNGLDGQAGSGYPEQSHSGKVGYGPNAPHGGLGDMITGKVEEIKGKVTKNPELVQHGHDVKTGVAEQRAHERAEKETAKDNPFANPDEKKKGTPQETHKEADKAVDHVKAKEADKAGAAN